MDQDGFGHDINDSIIPGPSINQSEESEWHAAQWLSFLIAE